MTLTDGALTVLRTRRWWGAAAITVALFAGGCGTGDDEATSAVDAVGAGRGRASSSTATTAPPGCAITAECTLPATPSGFEIGNLPDGWTVRDTPVDAAGAPAPGRVVRDAVAPDGRIVRIMVFPTEPGPVPEVGSPSTVAIGGGLTAYVTRTPIRNRPEEEVTVAVKPRDRLGILANAHGVPEDVMLAAVASIVVL